MLPEQPVALHTATSEDVEQLLAGTTLQTPMLLLVKGMSQTVQTLVGALTKLPNNSTFQFTQADALWAGTPHHDG